MILVCQKSTLWHTRISVIKLQARCEQIGQLEHVEDDECGTGRELTAQRMLLEKITCQTKHLKVAYRLLIHGM
jgi:hypothetical protein